MGEQAPFLVNSEVLVLHSWALLHLPHFLRVRLWRNSHCLAQDLAFQQVTKCKIQTRSFSSSKLLMYVNGLASKIW